MASPSQAYCTAAEVLTLFGDKERNDFSDKDGNGYYDSAALTIAIDAASCLIDSAVSQAGYTLPLASVPALLKMCCMFIVRYMLYSDSPDKVVLAQNNWAMAILFPAKGKLYLGTDFDEANEGVNYITDLKAFTRDEMETV